jgi:hypothetical protein
LYIVVDLREIADIRIAPAARESLMRHFLALALAPPTLPPRMMPPTLERLLVASSCRPHALAPRLIGTRLGAVPLAVITAPAHPQLLVTTCAIQHPVAALDDRWPSSPQKAGQVLPIASLSALEQALFRRSRGPPPKARGCYLGPSPFSEPGCPIALALPNETGRAVAPKYSKKIEPDPRSRWFESEDLAW